MLAARQQFLPFFEEKGWEVTCPQVTQTLSEDELCELVPLHDGWIIGDDPATRRVLTAGKEGRLKAAVKWGVGVDNVDFEACRELKIPVTNTPGMFGEEVADVALGYVIGLARQTYFIDRSVRNGHWPKPQGISLRGKQVGLIGYGDIGRSCRTRFKAVGMETIVYDPGVKEITPAELVLAQWPDRIGECDFLVFTCALTESSRHMLNEAVLSQTKRGVRIVNVARGPLIDQGALVRALQEARVESAALDVFEIEPLPMDSPLQSMEKCIFGSHNGSNTIDAVHKTNIKAVTKLIEFLGAG
jgi:D-3-phosphoglycerate dehydrogenase